MKTCVLGLTLFLLASVAHGILPPDVIVIEPETMAISGEGWAVRENFDGWFKGWTTGSRCLYGAGPGGGEATTVFDVPADGTYRVWVRYLDLGHKIRKGVNSFFVDAIQEKRPGDPVDLDLEVPPPAGDDAMLALDTMADARPRKRENGKEFDQVSMRVKQADLDKWGDSWAAFVWDSMDVRLHRRPCTLRITKSHPRPTERHQRLVDCIILTTNLSYEARAEDLTPLYVRFDVPATQTNSLRFQLRSRRADDSDFWPHQSFETPFVAPVRPGTSGAWIDLSEHLRLDQRGRYNRVTFFSFIKQHGGGVQADYTVNFATNAAPEAIVKTFERKGPGSTVSFRIDLNNRLAIRDEVGESAANLARSLATPAIGRYPTQFVFQTHCDVSGATEQTFKNEMQALRNLGINQISFPPGAAAKHIGEGFRRARVAFYTWNLRQSPGGGTDNECCLSPNLPAITKEAAQAEQQALKYPPETEVVRLAGFADEPEFNYLGHVPNCPVCRKAFPEYLKANGVAYEVFQAEIEKVEIEKMAIDRALAGEADGAEADGAVVRGIDAVRPSADTNLPHHFYWTSRFGINTATEFLRTGTRAAESNHPAWRTTLNFGNQLRSTLAGSGLDWFEIFRTGALTHGENEDYIAWVKNFQTRGYVMAVMRAACGPRGYDYGPLVAYPGSTGWDVVAGGFSQIGQGAKYFNFFNYGPHYMSVPSPCSAQPWVHDATRHLTYAAGAVEDRLFGARVMTGDTALLLSTTSDIWNRPGGDPTFGNLYGMERFYLYLVLRHLQASVDILAEEDLTTVLKRHRLLLATDSHLRRAYTSPVRDWVEAGGTLYVGANALAFDEYNQPLGLVEGMGVARGPLAADANRAPGRPEYELNNRKPRGIVHTSEPFHALFGTQELGGGATLFKLGEDAAALIEVPFGKGRVIAGCTFPAMEYIKTSDWNKERPTHSTVVFKSGPREFIGRVLERSGVAPRAVCDNMFLEANLLENGRHVIVALANWSGEEQEATVTFRGLGKVSSVKAVRTAIRIVEQTDDRLVVAGRFGAGDFLTMLR